MTYTFEIRGVEKKVNEKQKFIAWKYKNKAGEWNRLKFNQNVKNVPETAGKYMCSVSSENANVTSDDYGKVMWVSTEATFTDMPKVDTLASEF